MTSQRNLSIYLFILDRVTLDADKALKHPLPPVLLTPPPPPPINSTTNSSIQISLTECHWMQIKHSSTDGTIADLLSIYRKVHHPYYICPPSHIYCSLSYLLPPQSYLLSIYRKVQTCHILTSSIIFTPSSSHIYSLLY